MTYLTQQPDWLAGIGNRSGREPAVGNGSEDTGGAMVYARIRDWIVATALPIGRRLRAADIAAALRVSNTPVREALIRLSAEGLIENRRGSGFFIPIPRVEEAVALFEASHLIVQSSLWRLGRGDFPVDAPAIRLGHETDPAQTRHPPDVARLCVVFNRAVVLATSNPVLSGMLDNIEDRLFQLRLLDAETPSAAERQIAVVKSVSKAMQAGRVDHAVAPLAEHHAALVPRIPHLVERRILDGLAGPGEPSSLPA